MNNNISVENDVTYKNCKVINSQQRGQISFQRWSILNHPGNVVDILNEYPDKYIRTFNGPIRKVKKQK